MIMVVDDDQNILHLTDVVLNRLRCTVVTVSDPLQAIKLLESVTPDLFILDQMMPRMSGFELCHHIRSCGHTVQTPIIMLSARHDRILVKESVEAGANLCLPKTALYSDLIHHVRALLDVENARC